MRLGRFIMAWLKTLDVVVCTLWLSPLYLLGLASQPGGTEMISCYVGQAAFNNIPWGLRAAKVIDWIMLHLGAGPNHCVRAYQKDPT